MAMSCIVIPATALAQDASEVKPMATATRLLRAAANEITEALAHRSPMQPLGQ